MSQRGHFGPQKQTFDGLLGKFASIYGLKCPTERGSTSGEMVLLLPSEINGSGIHQDYVDVNEKLENAAKNSISCVVSTDQLTFSAFPKY